MSTVYLHLQSETQANNLFLSKTTLKFEKILQQSGNGTIIYNPYTGIITINQPGAYYVNWFVVGNLAQGGFGFDLVTSDARAVGSYSPRLMTLQDQVMGAAIITVGTPGLELHLATSSTSVVNLADVAVKANLVIYSLSEGTGPDINSPTCGTVVNFSNGLFDPLNPLTWPLIFEAFQFSWVFQRTEELQQTITPAGLEGLLGLPVNILSSPLVSAALAPAIANCQSILSNLGSSLGSLFQFGNNRGLVSMDSYIGHSTVGTVPAIAGGDLPIWSVVAGPPYPQIIARDGVITSFAADYGAIAQIDLSVTGFIPGVLGQINALISAFSGAVTVLAGAFGDIASILTGLGSPLTADYAKIMNGLILEILADGAPPTNLHMHAILWQGTKDQTDVTGKAINWHEVSELDLGAIQFIELGPIGSILSSFGSAVAAGANLISSLLSLLKSRGTPSQGLNSEPLSTALVSGLAHPVSAGDYLMVQYTLKGDDNTTLLAGVLASDLNASVSIL